MKNIFRALSICLVLSLISTGCEMGKVSRLEKENEQLRSEIIRSDSIQTQFMNAYSEIEYNLSEIREREKSIDRYSNEPGITNNSSMQEKILDDIAVIGRLLEDNRVKLANMQSLQKQLAIVKTENSRLKRAMQQSGSRNGGSVKSSSRIEEENRATQQLYERQRELDKQQQQQDAKAATANVSMAASAEIEQLQALNQSLQNTVTQLRQQIAESEARIEALQEELSLLKEAYAALQAINEGLQSENSKYKTDLAASKSEIDQKDAEIKRLNEVVQTAFYYIGVKKDAASKGLLVTKGAAPAYKDADFVRIENIFEKKIIETKSAKPVVVSNHPSSSYSLDNKDKANVKIVIKDPAQFWKVTKYLIIVTPK